MTDTPKPKARKRGGKEATELLKLINARAVWNKPPFRQPRFNPAELLKIREAADLHARANKSDPFARSRIYTHMMQGTQSASEVMEDANRLLSLRHDFSEAA